MYICWLSKVSEFKVDSEEHSHTFAISVKSKNDISYMCFISFRLVTLDKHYCFYTAYDENDSSNKVG